MKIDVFSNNSIRILIISICVLISACLKKTKKEESVMEDSLEPVSRSISDSLAFEYTSDELKNLLIETSKRSTKSKPPLNQVTKISPDTLWIALQKRQAIEFGIDVIYNGLGGDNRYEVAESTKEIRKNSRTVCGIIKKSFIDKMPNGNYKINKKLYFKNQFNLCEGERFQDQEVAPFCTGFGVAPFLVASAAHCLNSSHFKNVYLIFGYEMNGGVVKKEFDSKDVFEIVSIYALSDQGQDFVLFQTDKPLSSDKIANISRRRVLKPTEKLYVIGHPCGLPLKYADNGIVRESSDPNYFITNLDTYGGNSGSPVFSAQTDSVLGIFSKGEKDFAILNGCFKSNICPENGCKGEAVSRTSQFFKYLQ